MSWILKAEQFAYSELELRPSEFWKLTPAEFNQLRDGYYRRRRARLEIEAHWICVLVNHFPMRGKNAKSLRVEQLIGYSEEEKRKLLTKRHALERKRP